MNRQRVVIIGIDSLDVELVSRWSSEGYMPNFRKLVEGARWGLVDNPMGLEAGSVWPTFCTGVMPDYHGQFDGPYLFDTDIYEKRLMTKTERVVEPFWVAASKVGKRVAIIDVPYVILEDCINGVQVVDWLTHIRTRPEGLASQPKDLAHEIVKKYGTNPFSGPNRCPTNDLSFDTPQDFTDFRDRLLDRVNWKTTFSEQLLRQGPWDLFFTVFHDAHDAGHMCWHIHDPDHESYDQNIATQIGNPLRDVYAALDRSVGRLLEAIDQEATVIVYSSHGMGPERTATQFLDDILLAIETAYSGPVQPNWVDRISPLYRAVVPSQLRRRFINTKPLQKVYKNTYLEQLKKRRFFELPVNHATGGVRINMKGRERYGTVDLGTELEEVYRLLERDLRMIVNVDSGKPLVESIMRTSALYKGPMRQSFPDIFLEWNKSAPIKCVQSPLIGTLQNRYTRSRTGDHTQKNGVFFAMGPTIKACQCDTAVHAVDFAPTIGALLSYQDPRYMGTVIPGLW